VLLFLFFSFFLFFLLGGLLFCLLFVGTNKKKKKKKKVQKEDKTSYSYSYLEGFDCFKSCFDKVNNVDPDDDDGKRHGFDQSQTLPNDHDSAVLM